MSNLTENKPLLNRIVLGKKSKIFLRVLLWMEILVIGLYMLNIIFSYFITDAFDIQNIFTFHIEVWTILLDKKLKEPITPEDAVACMIGVKIARLAEDINKDDSWIDVIGYAALGGEIINDK